MLSNMRSPLAVDVDPFNSLLAVMGPGFGRFAIASQLIEKMTCDLALEPSMPSHLSLEVVFNG